MRKPLLSLLGQAEAAMLELDALKAALNDGEGRPPCPYLARLRHAAQDSSELVLSMDAVVIPSPPAANGGGAGGGGGGQW